MNNSFLEKIVVGFCILSVIAVALLYHYSESTGFEKNFSDEEKLVENAPIENQRKVLEPKPESSEVKSLNKPPERLEQETVFSKTLPLKNPVDQDESLKVEEQEEAEFVIASKNNVAHVLTLEEQTELQKKYDEILLSLKDKLDEKSSKDVFIQEELKRKAWKKLGQKYLDDPLAISALNHLEGIEKEMFARGLVAGLTQDNPKGLIDELLGKADSRNELVNALKTYDNKELGLVDEALLTMSPYNAVDALQEMNYLDLKEGTLNKVFIAYEDSVGLDLSVDKIDQLIDNQSIRDDLVFQILNNKNDYKESIYLASNLDGEKFDKHKVIGRLLQRWSENELPQALQYFDEYLDNYPLVGADLKKVLVSWKYSENSTAEHEIKQYFTDKIYELFREEKVDEAQSLLSALLEQKDYNPNVLGLISQMSNKDPQGTQQWLAQFKNDDSRTNEWKKTLYANWGRNNPEVALEAAGTLPIREDNEIERAYAYSNIAIRIAQHKKNHEVSPDWINDLPEGFVKDRSVAGYALGHVRNSKDADAEYLLKKQFQLDEVDLDHVLEIVQQSNLDQEVKDKFINFR